MKKYLIEKVESGITEGGFACGPVDGSSITSIKYKDENSEEHFLSICEFEGMPTFYLSEADIYDKLMEDTEESYSEIEQYIIGEFNGIELSSDYEEIEEAINKSDDKKTVLFLYLIIQLTKEIVTDDYIESLKGCDVDEIDFEPLLPKDEMFENGLNASHETRMIIISYVEENHKFTSILAHYVDGDDSVDTPEINNNFIGENSSYSNQVKLCSAYSVYHQTPIEHVFTEKIKN